MVKVLVLFGDPVDIPLFEQHFERVHRPLLAQIPQPHAFQINNVAGAVVGEPSFHLVVELHFLSEEAMQEGLNSDQGQAMARDLANFASGGVTILLCHSYPGGP